MALKGREPWFPHLFRSGRAHFKLFFKKENLDQKKRNFRGLRERWVDKGENRRFSHLFRSGRAHFKLFFKKENLDQKKGFP